MWNFPLFPEQASSNAERVDSLFLFELAIVFFFTTLICVLILSFAVRYRRRVEASTALTPRSSSRRLEVIWIGIPLTLSLVMYVWATVLFFDLYEPPGDAFEISVVGKQWMWYLQHPEGRAEINELHVPIGQACQADHDLARRDPQLLRAGVPDQARRAAGTVHDALVPAHQGGTAPPLLRRVLWHQPFADDRLGSCHGAGRLRAMAVGEGQRSLDGRGGGAAFRAAPLRGLPPGKPDRPRPAARRRLRTSRTDSGRQGRAFRDG